MTGRTGPVVKAAAVPAIIGPLVVAFLAAVISQRPSDLAVAAAALLILAVLAADAAIIVRGRKGPAAAALVTHVVLASFLMTYRASPLPPPAPFAAVLPPASPPADMAVFALLTGVTHRTASFGYRGGSFLDRRDFSMTAALVRHPQGDLLIDTGLGREIDKQFQTQTFSFRALTRYELFKPAADQLDAAGYDRKHLRAILITHAHWDHTSGLPDFPDTPILVTAPEHRFIQEGGWLTVIARGVPDARYREYGFEGGPYLGFPASHDVYGDGSIVVVPAPGHTPGSVVVFVVLPNQRRYAFIGDLAWQSEGISERELRPWLIRRMGRENPDEARANILRMAAIAAKYPSLVIVTAHDGRSFAGVPALPARVADDPWASGADTRK